MNRRELLTLTLAETMALMLPVTAVAAHRPGTSTKDQGIMLDENKSIVRRFNVEVIEKGNSEAFKQLMAPSFVNHSAPLGAPADADAMWNTLNGLRQGLSGVKVTIHDQIAEDDKVVTRKTISGTHSGTLAGVPPTGKTAALDVIEIVRIENGRYAEHWGMNNFQAMIAQLKQA